MGLLSPYVSKNYISKHSLATIQSALATAKIERDSINRWLGIVDFTDDPLWKKESGTVQEMINAISLVTYETPGGTMALSFVKQLDEIINSGMNQFTLDERLDLRAIADGIAKNINLDTDKRSIVPSVTQLTALQKIRRGAESIIVGSSKVSDGLLSPFHPNRQNALNQSFIALNQPGTGYNVIGLAFNVVRGSDCSEFPRQAVESDRVLVPFETLRQAIQDINGGRALYLGSVGDIDFVSNRGFVYQCPWPGSIKDKRYQRPLIPYGSKPPKYFD